MSATDLKPTTPAPALVVSAPAQPSPASEDANVTPPASPIFQPSARDRDPSVGICRLLGISDALVTFPQLFGGVLGIGVCGTVFGNELSQYLKKYAPEAPFPQDVSSSLTPILH
jgi:hypothetical protein